ncbi:MAG: hypothetical protein ABI895_39615 [Deltaproteobacteria bacterium]
MRSFKPDVLVQGPTELSLGGSRIELIPVQGGETDDALLIHWPEERLLFAGDILMPYIGAPFVEEGGLQGLLQAIDVVVQKDPKYLLHGHEPLTQLFSSPAVLAALRPHLVWLEREVVARVTRGEDRATIQQQNLIPDGEESEHQSVQVHHLRRPVRLADAADERAVAEAQLGAPLAGASAQSESLALRPRGPRQRGSCRLEGGQGRASVARRCTKPRDAARASPT